MIGLALHLPAVYTLIAEISTERLQELQRFAELGKVSASLIHDISSPLTAAILHLEQEERRDLHSIKHARRSIRILERYIEAARQQLRCESQTARFCVKYELDQVKRILKPLARRQYVRLCFNRHANYVLVGDPVKFQQILANLITNAIDAYQDYPGNKAEALVVRVTVTADKQQLVIRVIDWGKGIATDQRPYIFEPFYTAKRPQATCGMGIGLATVKKYVEDDFGGSINVASSLGRGTEFSVRLPRQR